MTHIDSIQIDGADIEKQLSRGTILSEVLPEFTRRIPLFTLSMDGGRSSF